MSVEKKKAKVREIRISPLVIPAESIGGTAHCPDPHGLMIGSKKLMTIIAGLPTLLTGDIDRPAYSFIVAPSLLHWAYAAKECKLYGIAKEDRRATQLISWEKTVADMPTDGMAVTSYLAMLRQLFTQKNAKYPMMAMADYLPTVIVHLPALIPALERLVNSGELELEQFGAAVEMTGGLDENGILLSTTTILDAMNDIKASDDISKVFTRDYIGRVQALLVSTQRLGALSDGHFCFECAMDKLIYPEFMRILDDIPSQPCGDTVQKLGLNMVKLICKDRTELQWANAWRRLVDDVFHDWELSGQTAKHANEITCVLFAMLSMRDRMFAGRCGCERGIDQLDSILKASSN